jgi:hypothetical protein
MRKLKHKLPCDKFLSVRVPCETKTELKELARILDKPYSELLYEAIQHIVLPKLRVTVASKKVKDG